MAMTLTWPRARITRLFMLILPALAAAAACPVHAEDGYELWLRYHPLPAAQARNYRTHIAELAMAADTPTERATRDELLRGLSGLLGAAPKVSDKADQDGALFVGTPNSSAQLARLRLDTRALGREGYRISSVTVDGHSAIAIVGNSDIGALYGAFRFLRLLQTAQSIDHLDIHDAPRVQLRLLDHWDNLDGSVERGYAGASIWDWWELPDYVDPRIIDYARANASIGINGAVLNNVNANKLSLTRPYLVKAAAIADVLRPYGIHVYLSVRFSSPIELGGLKTADPLDPAVAAWWRAKADEIYKFIPDFGGFLVKANSEGQPGPQDYGRTPADGANMLADALAPHGGVVMWRAFVYSSGKSDDRAKQSYEEFKPLDGKFRVNVILQVKNGPIDFQPREPFHPLFGAMPNTALMPEFEITKEYLGFATHLVYLGTLFQETLQSDTMTRGKGSTVARVIDGSLYADTPYSHAHRLTAMAGVANIGSDRDWCGSTFNQANWYAFGRLAWNPDDSARTIATDWVRMTFGNDPAIVAPIVGMMMRSREAAVDYMTPLGLHHQMHAGDHYGPAPWDSSESRAEWRPVYYNRADKHGIGFDRSSHGSNAVAEYASPVAATFNDLARIPDEYLLWFHHLPWNYRMRSGRTLWDELVLHYTHGVDEVAAMRSTWSSLRGHIDPERYAKTSAFLAIQQKEAQWWRDASIAYFQSLNGLPLPAGVAPPRHSLGYYKSLHFPFAPGYNSW